MPFTLFLAGSIFFSHNYKCIVLQDTVYCRETRLNYLVSLYSVFQDRDCAVVGEPRDFHPNEGALLTGGRYIPIYYA